MYDMVLTASDINFKILAKDKKIVSCNIIIVAGTIFFIYITVFSLILQQIQAMTIFET